MSRVVRGHGGTKVVDHEGNTVPAQADGTDDALRERALFVARDLPPMGWRTYFLSEGESASGSWAEAGVARVALEANMPIRPFWLRSAQGNLPLEKSLVSLDPVELVLSAFKPADDGSACILRVFNPGPDEIAGALTASDDFVDAMETDFLEQKTGDLALKDGTIALSFGPYEVKTVRLQYRDVD